jgi:serine/threonine protein kinase
MIGQMVSKYRIIEEIGRGSMGIVFKAQDKYLGRFAALKILAEKLANDPEMLYRFEREGGAASALNHPNICTVFETGSWRGRPYLAMELLTGQALDDRLAGGPIPTPQLVGIAIGVTSALEAAHTIGVVHRDIKPANLFLTAAGQVKILDFGLAKMQLPATPISEDTPTAPVLTRHGTVVGTYAYMSPEQACSEPLDGRDRTPSRPRIGKQQCPARGIRLHRYQTDGPRSQSALSDRPRSPRGIPALCGRRLCEGLSRRLIFLSAFITFIGGS